MIDTLLDAVQLIDNSPQLLSKFKEQFSFLEPYRRTLLVTGHRRESFGKRFEDICYALLEISRREDVQIVYPVHLNPNVQTPIKRILGDAQNVHLIGPLDYLPFVYLMRESFLILTDSGDVQEEAPSLDKPILVMREKTERPEGVAAETAKLVGTSTERIVEEVSLLLDAQDEYEKMARAQNPYGDGHASQRIVKRILDDYAI